MKKSVLGIVESSTQAEGVIVGLRELGIAASDVSVLLPDKDGTRDFAHEQSTKAPEGTAAGAGAGGLLGGGLGLLAGLGMLAVPGVGALIAAGPLLAALSGLAAGATVGGLTGALIGAGIPEIEAKLYEGKILDGNILIAAHVESADMERSVRALLERNGAHDVAVTGEAATPKGSAFQVWSLLLLLSPMMAVASACDETEARIDCASVCDRYKDCFDEDYDAEACADNCADDADEDDHQERVDACDSCLDGLSCTESVFHCADDCVGIVP